MHRLPGGNSLPSDLFGRISAFSGCHKRARKLIESLLPYTSATVVECMVEMLLLNASNLLVCGNKFE